MAKGHTHLKKLRSEKAKVKLKGSKYLPKGTNVTDTSFKIKQIVIKEQLKAANKSDILSKRKLNIKELLSRLQHYNTTVRSDAITDLKELVTFYPKDIVLPNLNQLIQGVLHLVLDKEKTIRLDSLKLIALILAQVTVEQVSPFFDILSSYFRCAMTHIDIAIQEDSLHLLDTLLTYTPSLVANNCNKILENFFDLISKLRTDSKPGRTLTVNLGSKMTTVKWRIKVLNRLYSLLTAINNEKMKNSSLKNIHSEIKSQKYESHLPIYHNDYVTNCVINLYDLKDKTYDKHENNIISYIDTLMPLLFETWLEVGPNNQKGDNDIDVALTEEAADILNCVLNIIQLLYKFLKIHENETEDHVPVNKFITKYGKQFINYIFIHFPYVKIKSRKRKRREKQNIATNNESFCITENLIICYIFCIFYKKINIHDKALNENTSKILSYVKNVFARWSPENEEQNNQSLLVLRSLLLDVSKSWTTYTTDLTSILNTTLSLYKNNKLSGNARNDLFNILCEIVHYENLNRTTQFQNWLSTLPELLCQREISRNIINVILLLAKQNNLVFLNCLQKEFQKILENIKTIKIIDAENEINEKYKILSLVYYVKSEDIFDTIVSFITNSSEEELKKYIYDILLLRYEKDFDMKNLERLRMIKI